MAVISADSHDDFDTLFLENRSFRVREGMSNFFENTKVRIGIGVLALGASILPYALVDAAPDTQPTPITVERPTQPSAQDVCVENVKRQYGAISSEEFAVLALSCATDSGATNGAIESLNSSSETP